MSSISLHSLLTRFSGFACQDIVFSKEPHPNLLVYDGETQFLAQLPFDVKPLAQSMAEPPPLSAQDYFQLCHDLWSNYHDSVNHTVGVAVTLGKDVPLGKLTPGYLADLVLLNWEDNSPLTLDKLLRCGTRHQFNGVMVGGHWVVKNGKSQTLDRETIEQEMRGQLARHSKNQLQQSARVAHNLAPYLRSFYSQWHETQ